MQAEVKILSVRLPEQEVRFYKSVAASRGVTIQEAVHEALDAWAKYSPKIQLAPLNALEGSLADVISDLPSMKQADREWELSNERRWL